MFHGPDVRLQDIPRGEKLVVIVRGPVSRFVSAFNGRLREDRPRYHYPWTEGERRAFATFQRPEELASALSSPDDELRERAIDAMHSIGHLNTPYAYWFGSEEAMRNRFDDILLIGFQERLDDDFETLLGCSHSLLRFVSRRTRAQRIERLGDSRRRSPKKHGRISRLGTRTTLRSSRCVERFRAS